MFECGRNHGVIAANAKCELLEWFEPQPSSVAHRVTVSRFSFADGVIEGIRRLLDHDIVCGSDAESVQQDSTA